MIAFRLLREWDNFPKEDLRLMESLELLQLVQVIILDPRRSSPRELVISVDKSLAAKKDREGLAKTPAESSVGF